VDDLMAVRTDDRRDALLLTITGEIDMSTEARLRTAIHEALTALRGRPLVVDLTAVRYLDSHGLRAIADGALEASEKPGFQPLRIVVDHNRRVVRPIELTGLDRVLALFETVDGALDKGGDGPSP
jgi:anti-sigma B factor antagonist